MKRLFLRALCVLFLAAFPAAGRQVIVNEIMFHPPPAVPEDPSFEWIELFNRGTNAVNLNGWRFSKGIDFTITTDTMLAPGGYLVVAADVDSFMTRYPGVANVIGGWTGTLANGGEEVELEEPGGINHDSVIYADEGDWAVRRRLPDPNRGLPSWEWTLPADGLGQSLELVNSALSNNSGQNWLPSSLQNGTPGQANSVSSGDIAPVILDVQHFPAVPRSTNSVTVTAQLVDEQTTGLSAILFYRRHSTQAPDEYNSLVMVDDGSQNDGAPGDGLFGAVIPPQPAGTVIEFYIQSGDGNLSRTWPAPVYDEFGSLVQVANALYQVDDEVPPATQPFCRLIMTETERIAFQNIDRGSDAQFNATFVTIDGTDTKVRHNVGVRIRGAGSRSANPPNYRVNVPKDRRWNGVSEINLNTQFGFNQLVGSVLLQKSGLVAADVRRVQVRVNGVNLANSGSPQYGSYVLVEVINGDWADRHLPNNSGGNIYRGSTGNHTADLQYRGEDPQNYLNTGYSKASNVTANDWTDLIELTRTLTSASDANYVNEIRQVINVEMWMRYFALFSILPSMETSIATGRGDDFGLYRELNNSQFIVLPHDLDTILGQGGSANVNAHIFRMCRFVGGASVVTFVLDRFMTNDVFVRIYFSELKRLMDTTFSPAELNPVLDSLLTGWVPPQTITAMKQFSVSRQNVIRPQILPPLSITTNLPIVSGFPRTTNATITLSGRASPIDIQSIRVNGAPAEFLAWQTTWTIPNLALNPGINRVLVQAFNQSGGEVGRVYIDIWNDQGAVTSAPASISTDTVWTPAAGPYRVTSGLSIDFGATLTVQPGTTVYLDPGASLYVGGSLIASGTDQQRIRFTRTPGMSGNWARIDFEDSQTSNRLSYVDFDFVGGNSLNLLNSTVFIDHASWNNIAGTILQLNNSSLVVRDSVFPALNGAEHIHGGPIPSGGFVIIDGNTFGGTTGLNDIIDFTGARRPGPVLQILNNVFTSASDDVLDLDGTDAQIEGNIFMRVHKNNADAGDTASAISYGQDAGYSPNVVAARNIFYDVDHVALCKEGGFLTLVNNTAVGISVAAVNFSEPERNTVPGSGAKIEGNIFFNPPGYTGTNFKNLFPTNGTVQLALSHNIFATPDGATNGVDGNIIGDPRLQNTDTNTITLATIRNDFSLRSGSPATDSGPNGLDMGALVPAGASISGEPVSPTLLTTATLTVGGPGITHYRYSLDGGAFGAETPVGSPITLSGLGNGQHSVRAIGRNSATVWQAETNAAISRPWTVLTSLVGLRINEILARNDSAAPFGGEFPDVVELYNSGSTALNLSGMGLTDDPADPYKFKFPDGTTMGPGGYLLLFADEEKTPPGLHLGFGLGQDGDSVYLYDGTDGGGTLIDSVVFGHQLSDLSIGRLRDGTWALTRPTLGMANVAQPVADSSQLKINEWLADGGTLFDNDFVEIFNADSLPVPLGGLYLSDTPQGAPTMHRITPLSFIADAGHLAFIADGDPAQGALHLAFKLSPDQGQIALFSPETNLIDCIWYGPQTTDVSEGRRPSGSQTFSFFGPSTQTQPTPGAPNPGAGGITTVTNITVPIFGLGANWHYDASGFGQDFTGWEQPAYDDSAWPVGGGLLAVETAPLPFPINTTFSPYSNTQIPYYFRTRFVLNTNLSQFDLTLSAVLDDGAVIYLNGTELLRVRMPAGPISSFTQALSPSVENASLEIFTVPASGLIQGTNVIAVEVHQASIPSSDVVWGMALDATRSFTNLPIVVAINEILANNVTITNLGGTNITDWIELYNPSINTVNLSGMSLTDDVSIPRRWVFPPGVTIASGARLVVQFDPDSPASTAASGPLNSGFGLGSNGDEVYLFDTPSVGGALIDSVVFGLQAPDFSVGRIPDGSGAWALTVPSQGAANIPTSVGAVANVKINEWLANPSGGDDDFFELFNPNPQPVELSGLYLTDTFGTPLKHKIAPLSFVGTGGNGFVRFIADNDVGSGPDHVGFGLSAGGEVIGFFTPAGVAIDSVIFGAQANGVSEGRFADGSANIVRFPGTASPGRPNLLPLNDVVVSEVLTHTDTPLEDAIELQNISGSSIDVSGWYLTDAKNDPKRFRIPSGTIIPAGSFVTFYEYQFNPDFTGRPPYFSLSSVNGDDVYLYTADSAGNLTGYRTGVEFGPQANGVSFGRHPTSIGHDFTAMSTRSFGADNATTIEGFRTGTGLPNPYPLVGPIVISEIMYHPPDVGTNDNAIDEFIELQNISASAFPLFDPTFPTNTWRLRDAVDFNFPMGVTIPAGGHVVVVGFDPAAEPTITSTFRTKYGIGLAVPIFGPWQGKLDNSAENIELYKPDPPQPPGTANAGLVPYVEADKVKYADAAPWPMLADGSPAGGVGYSLGRRVPTEYGNDPSNWIAASPTPGAATGAAALTPPSITSITAPHALNLGANDTLTVVAAGAPVLGYQWRFNGAAIPDATNASLTLNNFRPTDAGVYSVTAANAAGAASASTRVDLRSAPIINRQPQDVAASAGGSAFFSVVAGGTPPLAYQWTLNGTLLPGETNASLLVLDVQPPKEGDYRVVITNAFGSITSSPARLGIFAAPVITAQPQGTNAFVGATVTFNVGVSGSPPLRYQWRFNGLNIPNATNAILTLTNIPVAASGEYRVFVTNTVGSVLSGPAALNVTVPPFVSIVATDSSASEPGANTGMFTVSRTGSTALPLEFNFNVSGSATPGSDFSIPSSPVTIPAGASSTTLLVTPQNDPLLEGNETVVVTLVPTTVYGVGTPASATVTIVDDDNQLPSVTITNLPDGSVFNVPATVVIGATATDAEGSVARVEFFDNGTNKLGEALSSPFVVVWTNGLAGIHVLTAVATDNLGSVGVSAPVAIALNAAPTVIMASPANNSQFSAPATIVLAANASDPDGTVSGVEFYAGTTLLGSDSSSPYTFTWTNVLVGSYSISARATDNRGVTSVSPAVSITVVIPPPGFADSFGARGSLNGFTNYLRGTNLVFSKEPGEPRHEDRSGTRSAWVSWTAPASGNCTIDTLNSTFDTVLSVYNGNTISSLLKVAGNDDATASTLQSRVVFAAVAGTRYEIAVDGYSAGQGGSIEFHLSLPNPYPVITTQPQSVIVDPGANVTFTVGVSGTGPFAYQWRMDGLNLPGATSSSLVRNNVQTANQGTYTVVVSNGSGSVTSAPASLTLRLPPTIASHPQTASADPGGSATFSVVATGLTPFSYQWLLNGSPISGANSNSYTRSNVQYSDVALFSVVVTNTLGMATSQSAELLVKPRIVSYQLVPGGFQFTIHAMPNRAHAIDAATHLGQWVPLSTNTASVVESPLNDPTASNQPWRFYRVRLVQ